MPEERKRNRDDEPSRIDDPERVRGIGDEEEEEFEDTEDVDETDEEEQEGSL